MNINKEKSNEQFLSGSGKVRADQYGVNCFLNLLLLIFMASSAYGQSGTYQRKDKTGASCAIAVEIKGVHVSADIFGWWNTKSGRHGVFSGKGIIENKNTITLRSSEDSDCKVGLVFNNKNLRATFNDCMMDNLPEDFNGIYLKVTDFIPGEYVVKASRAFFYNTPNSNSPKKAYLVKGNRVSIELENIEAGGWVFVNYLNGSHKRTSGFMRLQDLQ